jgi:hypothetical protein
MSTADHSKADETLAIWNGQNAICEIPATIGTVEYRRHAPAAKKRQGLFHLHRIARDRPDRERMLLVAVTDPVRDPVSQNRPDRCAQPDRKRVKAERLNQDTKPHQDRRAWDKERNPHEGLAES